MAHLTSPSIVEMRKARCRQPKMPKVAETVSDEEGCKPRSSEIKFVALTLLAIPAEREKSEGCSVFSYFF